MPDFAFESAAPQPVCGVDEAGRGPWAGPVVAAAVVLDPRCIPPGLDDSKCLPAPLRAELFARLAGCAKIGVGAASVEEIDAINILQASFLAMRRALADLRRSLQNGAGLSLALVDGPHVPPDLGCPARAVVRGDALCFSIAAASIVAKVTRDRIMVALSQQFPGYGWETNMGYGVPAHATGLARLGVTPHHRRSFLPVHKIVCEAATITL